MPKFKITWATNEGKKDKEIVLDHRPFLEDKIIFREGAAIYRCVVKEIIMIDGGGTEVKVSNLNDTTKKSSDNPDYLFF